mmetsp:Transcript_34722/g.68325  ORF Transcript_34722/g.68325 Transcript_34722/m.68325 type:complete len:253 (+) Transcript_34722:905-1663(+)
MSPAFLVAPSPVWRSRSVATSTVTHSDTVTDPFRGSDEEGAAAPPAAAPSGPSEDASSSSAAFRSVAHCGSLPGEDTLSSIASPASSPASSPAVESGWYVTPCDSRHGEATLSSIAPPTSIGAVSLGPSASVSCLSYFFTSVTEAAVASPISSSISNWRVRLSSLRLPSSATVRSPSSIMVATSSSRRDSSSLMGDIQREDIPPPAGAASLSVAVPSQTPVRPSSRYEPTTVSPSCPNDRSNPGDRTCPSGL